MVALIMQLSPISDSTDLWDTLNTVSEALGNTLGVVVHYVRDENLGNGTNSTIISDNSTAMVSTWSLHKALSTVTDQELGTSADQERGLIGEGAFSSPDPLVSLSRLGLVHEEQVI